MKIFARSVALSPNPLKVSAGNHGNATGDAAYSGATPIGVIGWSGSGTGSGSTALIDYMVSGTRVNIWVNNLRNT